MWRAPPAAVRGDGSSGPDTAGPTAGAMAGTAVAIAISWPRRAARARRMVVVIGNGTKTAVPAAWMTRPVSRISMPGAAAMAVPAVNSASALRKMVRRW